jgi:ubiquinol-cytochrome c reductase cytochrome c subunit
MYRALVGATLFMALSTGVATDAPSRAQTPVAAPAGNAERGKALYQKTGCYQCHSNEAQGGTAGPRIGPNPVPFARFVAYLRAPRGEMPPYTAKVISEQDLADVYAFLEARPKPLPVASIPLLAR